MAKFKDKIISLKSTIDNLKTEFDEFKQVGCFIISNVFYFKTKLKSDIKYASNS